MLKVSIALLLLVLANSSDAARWPKSQKCQKNHIGRRLAVANSCTKFSICNEQRRLIERECPSGLFFDKKHELCNLPSRVNCDKLDSNELAMAQQCQGCDCTACCKASSNADCEQQHGSAAEETTTNAVEETTTNAVEETTTNVVEETTTNAVEETTTNAVEETTTNAVEETTTTTVSTPTSAATTTVKPHAMCTAVQDGIYYPYAENCEQYFVCLNGQPLIQNCPNNFYFNPLTKKCDYPSNVDCQCADNANAAQPLKQSSKVAKKTCRNVLGITGTAQLR